MTSSNLTPREKSRVAATMDKLVQVAADLGLTIERRDVPEQGFYVREEKLIVLSTRRYRPLVPRVPRSLDLVFTLAHELGHHLSQDESEAAGCIVNQDLASDVLYEEARAWDKAMVLLASLGIKGTDYLFVDGFHLVRANSLMLPTGDFAAAHHAQEISDRKGTRCPDCRSPAITVLGLESRGDMALACLACGTHTRPHRTLRAVCRALAKETFGHVCGCDASGEIAKYSTRYLGPTPLRGSAEKGPRSERDVEAVGRRATNRAARSSRDVRP